MNSAPINLSPAAGAQAPIQLPGLFAQFAGSGGLPFGGPRNSLQLFQDMSWTKGTHTVRFGGAYNYQQLNVPSAHSRRRSSSWARTNPQR